PRVKRRKNPARRQPPADSMPVVVIPPALGEVEHVLVRNRAPVADLVRYRVRLDPYHVITHEPALLLQRDGEPVRDEQELFRPCPLAVTGPVLGPQPEPARPLLQLPALVRALAAPVRVADIDPQRAGLAEQVTTQTKDLSKVIYELFRMIFNPDLPVNAILPLALLRPHLTP